MGRRNDHSCRSFLTHLVFMCGQIIRQRLNIFYFVRFGCGEGSHGAMKPRLDDASPRATQETCSLIPQNEN